MLCRLDATHVVAVAHAPPAEATASFRDALVATTPEVPVTEPTLADGAVCPACAPAAGDGVARIVTAARLTVAQLVDALST